VPSKIWSRLSSVIQSLDRRKWMAQIKDKGSDYWFRVAILTLLGLILGRWLGQAEVWKNARYHLYQVQTRWLKPEPPFQPNVVFVLINDEEYWKGELARRVPVRRDYLARLVRVIDGANADVIALDFDLRSPVVDDSLVDNPAYAKETRAFLDAVGAAAQKHGIVIPREVELGNKNKVRLQSDIFRGFNFSGNQRNVFPGYIQLSDDARIIPPRLETETDDTIDSFALAILHASSRHELSPTTYDRITGNNGQHRSEVDLRFGSFLSKEQFDTLTCTSGEVLAGNPNVLNRLQSKTVIVGGKWHTDAFGRGTMNDEHMTPSGDIVGAYLQGNYAEALRVGHYFPAVSEALVIALEIFLVAAVSIAFVLKIGPRLKIAAILLPAAFVMLMSYLFLQNIGHFFEFIVPLSVILAHTFVDRILDWRKAYVAELEAHRG
jgi:CHASE2 domain-containing sensor protein